MVAIAGTIMRHTDLEDILSAITKELSAVVKFDRSSIAFLQPGGRSLALSHIYKVDGPVDDVAEGRRIELDESTVIGWVATHRQPVFRRNITSDERFVEVVKEAKLKSDLVVPLVARDNLIGTLNLGGLKKNAFNEEDLDNVVSCARLVCGAIEHALLLEEAKDIGERYRTLQKYASDIFMLVDKNTGRLIEVNRKCCEALGYSEDELKSISYFDLFPKEERLNQVVRRP
jgi:GAF domain-containing protein